jgi:hypothetical protein
MQHSEIQLLLIEIILICFKTINLCICFRRSIAMLHSLHDFHVYSAFDDGLTIANFYQTCCNGSVFYLLFVCWTNR